MATLILDLLIAYAFTEEKSKKQDTVKSDCPRYVKIFFILLPEVIAVLI